MGHVFGSYEQNNLNQILLEDVISEVEEEDTDLSGNILYKASFEELSRNYVQYDTIIWVLIAVLLILAWGVGVLILLYIPIRRYVLQMDISSRKLYINSHEIVYKTTRPLLFPFLGCTNIEKRIPLHLVIDVIIEQGCLQAVYGIHTFRVESVTNGMTRPVDELQIQGVSNPDLLRQVIILEAAKNIQEVGMQKSKTYGDKSESFQSPRTKNHVLGAKGTAHSGFLLQKVEEIRLSMKKIESLVMVSENQ